MEKKLITEMKFMMERLENPRMTYTEYEKKHKSLIKEGAENMLNWAQETFENELTQNKDAKISIEGDKIVFDNGSSSLSNLDFSGEKFAQSNKSYTVDDFNNMEKYGELDDFVKEMKGYLTKK